MKDLNKKIIETNRRSLTLTVMSKDPSISYEKSKEIQKLQDKEWKRLQFYKNISKKMR